MKRMFNREFVIYPQDNKFVIFNYPTAKGLKNRQSNVMYIASFIPTQSSWDRIEKLLWKNKYKAEMAMNDDGAMRFIFMAGASKS